MNEKKSEDAAKIKRVTWTVQPEKDVLEMVNDLLGLSPERGALTRLVNAALRTHGKEAANRVIDNQIAALIAKKNSVNSPKISNAAQTGFQDSVKKARKNQKFPPHAPA